LKIREVIDKDIADLLPLLDDLGYPVSFEDFNIRLKRFLQNPGYGVVVCEMGKQIVGLVAWSKSSLFISDSTRFHIEGLVVASRYRGQGIGKMLMKFVEDISKESSPAIIDLTSGLRRAKAGSHEFYKNLGYKNEGYMAKLYLRKEL
jgi:GNAT superfamily N-acetyltransferase